MMKRICTFITLVLLLIGGCSTTADVLKAQRRERDASNDMARKQVDNAKHLPAH